MWTSWTSGGKSLICNKSSATVTTTSAMVALTMDEERCAAILDLLLDEERSAVASDPLLDEERSVVDLDQLVDAADSADFSPYPAKFSP